MKLLPTRVTRVLRRLGRAPLFTFVSVLTLALGIGANTAIFSVIQGVLLKPLPFDHPDELVGVWHTAPGLGVPLLNQAPAFYLTYREEGRTFQDIGMWDPTAVSVTGAGEPERVDALEVTDGMLTVLRVQPFLGRRFTAEDDSPRTPARVMLAYSYWARKFGSDPSVIGRQLTVDGTPREIIGVLPASFRFLSVNPQLVLPFRLNRAEVFVGNFSYMSVARLKPGMTIAQANADVARMIPLVMERFPMPPGFTKQMAEEVRLGPNLRPLAKDVIGDVGRVLWVLLGTVGIVLLIACANVANLFLVRAEGRQQELAIHAALGAGSRRIAWELLSESLVLGVIGGAAGLLLAYAGVHGLVATAPAGLPRVQDIGFDPMVLLFTLAISLFAGALFAIIPVIKFATPRLASALNQGGRLGTASRQRHRARNALVVAEIALAVVLLVASGLMIRTFQAMRHVNPGFTNPSQVLTLRISIPDSLIKDPEQTARTHEQIARRLEQTPGVVSVGLTSSVAMDDIGENDPIFVEDFPGPGGRIPPIRKYKMIEGSYFTTMGNTLVAGRALTWSDSYNQFPVVVVSENFAREYWKDPAAALGRRIRNSPDNPWRTIVGVVGDEHDDGLAKPAPAIIYWPLLIKQFWTDPVRVQRSLTYVVRTERAKSPTLVKEIQQAVWSVNGSLPVANMRTLTEIMSASMAQTSFALVMLGIAAAVALMLGIVGIYGVIAYVASQRTKEIGIRIALGALSRDVTALFLRQGLLLACAGILIGMVAAGVATRVMTALLYGVGALDPVTYAAVATGLGLTALLASYVPAARAARVDPAEALRREV
ncbi:MAG: multidrug ABC transporter substrate-binding protein [Acidobacteria bacterium]|nr:MAG: multidrug ABC transporter substrate-binding protein [Acidobacteriota bacterium]